MLEPNFTCPICGKQLHIPPSELAARSTCSAECRRVLMSKPKIEDKNFTCPICNKQVWFPPSQLSWRRTCSIECYAKWKKGQLRYPQSGITCINCGKFRRVRPATIRERNPQFCSMQCMGEYRRKNGTLARENHPNWKGDDWTSLVHYIRTSTPYLRWLEAVRNRGNGVCEQCGGEGIHTHHTIPLEIFLAQLFDPNLGELLCEDCHHERHAASTSK